MPSIFYPYRYTVLLKSVSDSLATQYVRSNLLQIMMTAIYYLSVYPYEILVEILEPYFFAIARFSEPLITIIQWHLLILLVITVCFSIIFCRPNFSKMEGQEVENTDNQRYRLSQDEGSICSQNLFQVLYYSQSKSFYMEQVDYIHQCIASHRTRELNSITTTQI